MAELLKDRYDRRYVDRLAAALLAADGRIDPAAFSRAVFAQGWGDLELKQRMHRIAESLHNAVPGDYLRQLETLRQVAPDFSGFEAMFFPDFVESYGQDHVEASLAALGFFTSFSSSEFAVRPFIVRHPARTLEQLRAWAESKDEHQRRLASEGCRPRLPWGLRLTALVADPAPILPILERLRADPSEYVRRSVANNLNDISKDHPALVLQLAQQWRGECAATDALLKHACRTLLKRGEPQALRLFGHHPVRIELKNFRLARNRLAIGAALEFSFSLRLRESEPARLRIEYAVDFVKAAGHRSRKVFKIAERDVLPQGLHAYARQHDFADLTTRRHHPGAHRIAVLVNGRELGAREFTLLRGAT